MASRRILAVTLCALIAVAIMPVLAGDVLDRIVERGEMRVGMTGTQPPLNMVNHDGELMGFEVDMVHLLGDSMEVEVTLVTKSFVELLPALRSGHVDMIVSGVTITPQRNTKVAFVGPYTISGKSLLSKSASLAAVEEIEELNNDKFHITALKGSTSQDFVEKLLPEAKFTATDHYDAAVQMVLEGQADVMVADSEICQVSVFRFPEAELETSPKLLTVEPIGIVLPRGDPLLVNLIENYLETLDNLGQMEELRQKWFEDGSWLSEMP